MVPFVSSSYGAKIAVTSGSPLSAASTSCALSVATAFVNSPVNQA